MSEVGYLNTLIRHIGCVLAVFVAWGQAGAAPDLDSAVTVDGAVQTGRDVFSLLETVGVLAVAPEEALAVDLGPVAPGGMAVRGLLDVVQEATGLPWELSGGAIVFGSPKAFEPADELERAGVRRPSDVALRFVESLSPSERARLCTGRYIPLDGLSTETSDALTGLRRYYAPHPVEGGLMVLSVRFAPHGFVFHRGVRLSGPKALLVADPVPGWLRRADDQTFVPLREDSSIVRAAERYIFDNYVLPYTERGAAIREWMERAGHEEGAE